MKKNLRFFMASTVLFALAVVPWPAQAQPSMPGMKGSGDASDNRAFEKKPSR